MKGITIMKDKTVKSIRWCCYIALGLCTLWGLFWFGSILLSLFGVEDYPIRWFDWTEYRAYKITVFVGYSLSIAAMIALCVKMIINVLKGLHENTVFPKSNVSLLLWFVLADFVYRLAYNNLHILYSELMEIHFNHTNLVTPFFLLFFAFRYKVAADAVEENSLTI